MTLLTENNLQDHDTRSAQPLKNARFYFLKDWFLHQILNSHELKVYRAIAAVCFRDGHCTRSNAELSSSLHLSETTIKKIKKSLSKPFAELANEPLIFTKKNFRESGGHDKTSIFLNIFDLEKVQFIGKHKFRKEKTYEKSTSLI